MIPLAFDVVMPDAVDQKGSILTQLSDFWFRMLPSEIPELSTHWISTGLPMALERRLDPHLASQLRGRSMVVRKLKVLPIESIVRGYLTGSAWASYQQNSAFCGIKLPAGLKESQKLAQPLWTPSTKAEQGGKDENISPQEGQCFRGLSSQR